MTISPPPTARPWDTDDTPPAVLARLAGEAERALALSAEVAARLRRHVVDHRDDVLAPAHEAGEHYAEARRKHLDTVRRALGGAALRAGAFVCLGPVFALAALGPFVTAWLAADLVTPGWHLPFLAVAALLWWGSLRLPKRWAGAPIAAVAVSAAAAGPWLGFRLFGEDDGIGIGIAVLVGAVVVGTVGAVTLAYQDDGASAAEAQGAFDTWVEQVYRRGVLPAAALVANSPGPVYSTRLAGATSWVDFGTVVDVETPATADLRRLLSRNQGSFALAGPRGAGKTTLLERWCEGRYLDDGGTAALAVKVEAPVGYDPREFLVHLFGKLCDAAERYAPAEPPRRPWYLRYVEPERPRWSEARITPAELGVLARRERERIRYVRRRTVEREAGFDLSWVVKPAVKRRTSVTRDDVPLNHPELVDEFRWFLRKTAEVVGGAGGKVLVAVDELDRIGDGEQAQRFLNELKAVFDVPNCFFLVSVSEDALGDFELAAMGVRSAFDSAFDAVVRVDYLGFAEARTVLHRRVVNLPEQFAALAHVFSGGLARELVRVVEVMAAEGGDLADVTARLVRRLLTRTTRAAAGRLLRTPDRHAGAVLLPVLDELPTDLSRLRDYAAVLESTEVGASAEAIRLDVVVTVEYLATVLAVFDGRLDERRSARGLEPGHGGFDTLARVRRHLGANPHGARELLAAFDRAWGLSRCGRP
ncbi:hypothetical protein ACIQMJ_37665 [Actinosynnema sp. NPDC091369]